MNLFEAIILGILQGVFEWLPVSSQGQIIAVAIAFFQISTQEALKHSIFLHTGTLIAAIIFFRKELIKIIQGENPELRNFILIAVLATIITAVPSFFILKQLIFSSTILLFLIGFLLIITGLLQKIKQKQIKPKLNKKNSIILGLMQGFSVLPGISRSGITTATLLFEGFEPEEAFRISFLLSVPTVLIGEIAYGLVEGFSFEFNSLIALVFAFVFGLISIDLLLKLAKRISFSWFAIGFGLIYLIIGLVGV